MEGILQQMKLLINGWESNRGQLNDSHGIVLSSSFFLVS